jgi:hypothetical protein
MSLKIVHKNGTIAGTPPATGDIDVGEIAINAADAELYTKDTNGNIRKFQNTTTGTADGINFTQAGTGAAQRTVDSKLKDIVSIKDFGAVGDGVTNDRNALQSALNTGKNVFIPDGVYLFNSSVSYTAHGQAIYGSGNNSVLKSGSGSVYIITNGKNNVSIHDLKVVGTSTNGGYQINGGSQNVTISRIYWYQGQQRVWLFACGQVKVLDCTFDNTGYGVIQQLNFSSSHVLVANCLANNMANDFVEANCATGAPSFMWSVVNCVFTGSDIYPATATEKRFVGITAVNGVVISGNTVEKCSGDAPIHLEDIGGETVISNNVFDNCLVSNGQTGYVYLLNSAENTVITGNIFQRTDASLGAAHAVWCANLYTNKIIFANNRVIGQAAGGNFSGLNIGSFFGAAVISGNYFQKLNQVVSGDSNTTNLNITGNTIDEVANPLIQSRTLSSVGYRNFLIANNVFRGTTGSRDILTQQNTNGTNAPQRVTITGNKLSKGVTVTGQPGATSGASGDAEDIQVINNVFASTASLTFGGTMSRRISSGNIFEATGTHDITGSTVTATTLNATNINATNINATNINATNLGNFFEGLIDWRPLIGKTHFSDYQGGVNLSGTSSQYVIQNNFVLQTAETVSVLFIGNGFILPKNYSGTISYGAALEPAGLFELHLESSIDGTTWTSLQVSSSGGTGSKTYAFSSLTDATALRFRFRNFNGTTGNIGVSNVVIPGLTAAQIAAATGTGRVVLNQPHFPNVGTTATAANAFLDNATTPANRLLRSTSSIRYKTDVENLETPRADAILGLRPVWYRSLAEADPSEWSYYGLIAEEVAEIEPRLVTWTYPADAYETVEETVEIEGEEFTQTVTKLKEGAVKVPDGVQYDRLAVLLLDIVKRQQQQIDHLLDQ